MTSDPTSIVAIGHLPHATGGIDFPLVSNARPTTPVLTRILADASGTTSQDLRRRVLESATWRTDYATLLAELTSASARETPTAYTIATEGLASARRNMIWAHGTAESPLDDLDVSSGQAWDPGMETVTGTGRPVMQLQVPYRGRQLAGSALLDQLDVWVAEGTGEPSFRDAIARVVAHPEWLPAPGRRIVLIGAGAELSPLAPLTTWGADVLAIDVAGSDLWRRIGDLAGAGAGTVQWPLRPDGTPGLDVTSHLRELTAWLNQAADDAPLVLGMYAYADRGAHVRVTMAVDLMATHLCTVNPETSLSYLATPTDAFVVPREVVHAGHAAWRDRGALKHLQWLARCASRGALFQPSYTTLHENGTGIADILVPQQGPSYALAKRLQRWRGIIAEHDGHPVSFNVAPASWTRSVTRNRVLAAAYRGARHFRVEVFEPDTCRVLMAALLVHDLHHRPGTRPHPEALFSDQALHGGLWRSAYEPKSALGFAALLGALTPH
ncbi:hypothetical protein [Rhodococcus tibetensis]|uniref:Uncharacterized protein n=1 Tax=Rhodococcus tibetensis TaxID=2965064 RepID=A0ABT1QHV9_9NOCA|nr:hypothetical protein [Rhodococcus sp. FXJ9.536]MCQ4121874.1 hypothetical protein [Rhodococcus sp. FXJ9.536]